MSTVPTASSAEPRLQPGLLTLPIFIASIGLSAFLLFSVQPLFAKLVLPVLGGSPSVWSVTSVMFQCLLLGGYAYAHALAARPARQAAFIHVALLLAAALTLPIALGAGWRQPPAGWEIPWLALIVLVSAGLPFFALSANGPLLQAWFSRTRHRQAADPYFLYAASNIGSFVALAAYPFLIEPIWRLREQTQLWSFGFGALILLIAGASLLTQGAQRRGIGRGAVRAPSRRDWMVWMAISALPSGLLVGVTATITTDIAPMPLLWIAPLGLYLLSFIVAFRPGKFFDHPLLDLARIGLTTGVLLVGAWTNSLAVGLALHLGAFWLTACCCHRMLFRLRPDSGNLTAFYLALSTGGAIGGLFCGILAPLVFDTLAEYPVFLIAALVCRPSATLSVQEIRRDLVVTAGFALLAIAVTALAIRLGAPVRFCAQILSVCLAVFAILYWRRLGAVLVCLGAFALVQGYAILPNQEPVHSIRSFFGIHRVHLSQDRQFRQLSHGSTLHGAIRVRNPDGSPVDGRPEPTTYYSSAGAIGRSITSVRDAQGGTIGSASLVGLGTGALACYWQAGESWSFYEIDRSVVELAQDASQFRYLRDCAPSLPVVLGDARLTLAQAPTGQDLLVLDAFSSDAIPTHLLTREALALYLSRLGPHGVIVAHISNRHLDLRRILASTAADLGLVALTTTDTFAPNDDGSLRTPAMVMLLARDLAHLGPVAQDPAWRPVAADPTRKPWTDDFSNVLEAVLDFHRR